MFFKCPENTHIHNAPFNCIIENVWPRFIHNHQEQRDTVSSICNEAEKYQYLLTSEGLPNQEMKMGIGRSCRLGGLVSVLINFNCKLHMEQSSIEKKCEIILFELRVFPNSSSAKRLRCSSCHHGRFISSNIKVNVNVNVHVYKMQMYMFIFQLFLTSSGNRNPDLLILSTMQYPLGHTFPLVLKFWHGTYNEVFINRL